MYKAVDQYLADNNINEAMGECIRNNHYHLGLLLGRLHDGHDEMFHTLLGQLTKHVLNTRKDNLIINEVVENRKDNPSLFKEEKVETISKIEETSKDLDENIDQVIVPKITKVKLLCNWTTSRDLANCWNKMSQGNYTWNNIRLVWDEDPDYYVIVNCPPIGEFPDCKKSILFRMEPFMEKRKDKWMDWSEPNPADFLKACYHKNEYNNIEWHLSQTYNQLKTEIPEKKDEYSGILSTVLSAKYSDIGHIKRIDFVKFLERKGLPVHVYGDNKWGYKDYKGSLPYHCKDNALMPYKYTFNVENNSIPNYFTEKIVDGILSECLVFYSGCFNLKEYLPEESFVYLELSNFEKDYQTIKTAIQEDWWTKRIEHIRKAKKKILEELQFFPRIERILNQ